MSDLEEVLAEHGRTLGRVIASYAPPGPERDDLAHDVAVALLRALPRFRGESSVRTYVLRIAHNQGAHHAWQRRRHRHAEAEVAEAHAPPGDAPDLALAARRQAEALAAIVREIPVGGRQVLTLALEGLSHAEIAETLGLTENAVAVRLHRARAHVKARMEANHGR
jgi:RNA polymerase sigma-70 factor (ECF subfamily)